jgi:hypothetical protein
MMLLEELAFAAKVGFKSVFCIVIVFIVVILKKLFYKKYF